MGTAYLTYIQHRLHITQSTVYLLYICRISLFISFNSEATDHQCYYRSLCHPFESVIQPACRYRHYCLHRWMIPLPPILHPLQSHFPHPRLPPLNFFALCWLISFEPLTLRGGWREMGGGIYNQAGRSRFVMRWDTVSVMVCCVPVVVAWYLKETHTTAQRAQWSWQARWESVWIFIQMHALLSSLLCSPLLSSTSAGT